MTITLRYSPILKLESVVQGERFEVPAGCTARALLDRLGIRSDHQRYLIVYANGKKQTLGYTLRNGDSVQLFLPIGGG
jgi:sulfur carrier protein ThiS